ncbi:YiaA/YiaB family inner membrane protein [Nocardioides pyridinolyticus]
MDNNTPAPKNTTAFYAQAAIAFGLALFAMLVAVYYLPADPWPKAFLALSTIFLTTSAFTLAKCVRDAQENQHVVARLDQARVDKILSDHDPWKQVS